MALHVSVEAWLGKSLLFMGVSGGGHKLSLAPEFDSNFSERLYMEDVPVPA